ncbi:MAG: UDP-N-acetylglucosamine 2-epimerase (non-hydrolyzing) [Actinobacteria bacterium]|nr:UDP-N-acetylglucosamine 2-epimerase (non-hydrolyzing) [Actinomycetota bacterium]MBU1609364.1 UDP-N-acetylglucosamine 2-epimerase (non-hydrolyzing) [Actinomycetota bacterium]MBU2314996.1 UDP-N-acetylglucosamine 2-epimerase (non-hydrolyzing) [Actinomycetota bacterium]MBU2385038.1 UDP-N-acetylglucosamine 2-epimerase (non-hydrolyzing) [Actinomycetota bacterium]
MHVVGARPNFVKAAPVMRALAQRGAAQVLIHTGQHYDAAMSDVIFTDLGLPQPDYNLGVGSGSHAQQTAAVMTAIEPVLLDVNPAALVVYGDVNSTLAAALVAVKLGIAVVHVEAGLRSFDNSMPEEINRRLVDQLSHLLLITSTDAAVHIGHEGISESTVRFVGNPMIDSLFQMREGFDARAIAARVGIEGEYAVATIHRPSNVDDRARAEQIVQSLHGVANLVPLVIPVHPRSRPMFESLGLAEHPSVVMTTPLGYRDFLSLVSGAVLVVTDSGGIQEETTMLDIPCLTVRTSTERPITISHGTNQLVRLEQLVEIAERVVTGKLAVSERRPPLWDGRAGERCADEILALVSERSSAR